MNVTIGDVGHPDCVGRIYGERALQMIRRYDGRATCDRPWRFIATNGLDLVFAHEALDTMQTAAFARFSQIAEHAPRAIDPVAGRV